MKISLNWLKEYVDIGNLPVPELISLLTMSGLEVEDYKDQNEIYKDFIVGFVKDKKKHPNADRLSLCTVYNGKEDLQVVCGAPNVDKGQKIIFAPVGSTIPKGNFVLKKAKIRGTESCGMICSEDELGLGDNHDGILVLDSSLVEGTPICDALNLNDVLIEIAITPNRPDALSHIGVARDISALLGKELKIPKVKSSKSISKLAEIEIEDKLNCPRYSAKIVKNVKINESPAWLKNKIKNIGLRPINNIVDVTNFVMHEVGQPLHAFDLNNLSKKKIIVKSTKEISTFKTLDSKDRKLPKDTLMICDGEKPIAIAGVMGGENSEINLETKDILIESAYFNPSSIRKTSKALALNTDASYRFERGTNPNITDFAAIRAAELIAEVSGGKIEEGIIDNYPNKIEPKKLTVRFTRISKLLGFGIDKEKIKNILSALELNIIKEDKDNLIVTVPTFRPDIEREVDIIEEIARINGYENIPTISKISITLDKKTDETTFTELIKSVANSLGFYEMINNPLLSKEKAMVIGDPIIVKNPQNLDMEYLRTSLIQGGLKVVSHNIKFGEKDLQLYEVGNVFNKTKKNIKSFDDFTEKSKLLFIVTGKSTKKEWNVNESGYDFYKLKGFLNSFERKIFLDNVLNDSYNAHESNFYDNYFQKNYKGKKIGEGGKLNKKILEQFDISQDVFLFEYDLEYLKDIAPDKKYYIEPLKFPKIYRDFAFIFDKEIIYNSVIEFISKNSSELSKSVRIFDLFENESLGKNKKSLAFALEYYSKDRTLTEEEVEKDFRSIIAAVTKKFDAQLRGN
ncbi:MAG: phenylalanine--tRNA ligase subunit beta [Ignavibacteriales bacterium CG_4_9_14_3_um_filter_30_11]|nr:MAG: phenylalanine--tRNA ligase subunit beta [Ignavibacteriales bacterium CG_4_9_14_3_um_filter_30_11]